MSGVLLLSNRGQVIGDWGLGIGEVEDWGGLLKINANTRYLIPNTC